MASRQFNEHEIQSLWMCANETQSINGQASRRLRAFCRDSRILLATDFSFLPFAILHFIFVLFSFCFASTFLFCIRFASSPFYRWKFSLSTVRSCCVVNCLLFSVPFLSLFSLSSWVGTFSALISQATIYFAGLLTIAANFFVRFSDARFYFSHLFRLAYFALLLIRFKLNNMHSVQLPFYGTKWTEYYFCSF